MVWGEIEDSFLLMLEEVAVSGEFETNPNLAAFTMGTVPGNGGLSNVAPYVFVESPGGLQGFIYPWSPPDTYDALEWPAGPIAAGDWVMFIEDAGTGDRNSIGEVKIGYCGECDNPI